MKLDDDIVLIAGPTASGKTGLAIEIAQSNDAVILNADSMQVYEELRIVSARPSDEEMAKAPHELFGHVKGNQDYSVARWLKDVEPFLKQGRKLVLVGGTGLYFNALLEGLSPMPEIKPEIRNKWRKQDAVPAEKLHALLDREAARELRPSDRQRIIRALEVFDSTGKSIVEWQRQKGETILPKSSRVGKLLLMPERSTLHGRINLRFEQMVEHGAVAEVRNLLALGYPTNLPVMKAIGVPHLAGYLKGQDSLSEAMEKAKAATRQYAKRQSTWFRNSFGEGWKTLNP